MRKIGMAVVPFKPPTGKKLAALKWEIKRRYEQKSKVTKRGRAMAAIRIAELSRWLHDLIGVGAELDASQWSEAIARIFVHHFVTLGEGNRKAADWLDTYAPWIARRDREHMITEANHCPLKWSADKLAQKLDLTDAKRTELKITTIGAIDCTKEQRAARRKQRRKLLMRLLRQRRKASTA